MNILFTISSSEVGGAQKWVKEQKDLLESSGHNVYLCTNEIGWLTRYFSEENLFLDRRISQFFSVLLLFRMSLFLRKYKVDVVVASSASAGVFSRLLRIFTSAKLVYVSHGWSALYAGKRIKKLLVLSERLMSFFTDQIWCVSESDYHKAIDEIRISRGKLELVPNRIFPVPETYAKKSISKGDRKKILMLARMAEPKNPQLLIEACSKLDVDLYLVGSGPLKEGLVELCKGMDNIHFLGEVAGFSEFHEFDIFALISNSEGLPMSALEAMSVGLPLVLSNVGACSELVRENNGIVVENNVTSIQQALSSVLAQQEEMSHNSKVLFNREYDLRVVASDISHLYESID